jgi:hypothetical protein
MNHHQWLQYNVVSIVHAVVHACGVVRVDLEWMDGLPLRSACLPAAAAAYK